MNRCPFDVAECGDTNDLPRPTGTIPMGKKLRSENFKSDDELSEKLAQAVCALDKTKSEVIRACIHLALPQLVQFPSILRHVED